MHTVRNEMQCGGETEIIHELVHDTARKYENHELIRVVSWTNSWSISVSPLHFISFWTVHVHSIQLFFSRHLTGAIPYIRVNMIGIDVFFSVYTMYFCCPQFLLNSWISDCSIQFLYIVLYCTSVPVSVICWLEKCKLFIWRFFYITIRTEWC